MCMKIDSLLNYLIHQLIFPEHYYSTYLTYTDPLKALITLLWGVVFAEFLKALN